jgi:hypothetical protein
MEFAGVRRYRTGGALSQLDDLAEAGFRLADTVVKRGST